jgi:predicted metalloprotease with PDZ domain
VAKLAEKFVCVRIQSMNGQNIGLLQFEYDLTWMAFFMDAQNRFYARYGGREDGHAESYLTKASLVRTMEEVLRLHADGQVQKSRYEPTTPKATTPEDISTMKKVMHNRKERCIHCHDVKVALLRERIDAGTFAKSMIFTYPPPSSLGLRIDPDDQSKILDVAPETPAAKAGLRSGDRLVSVDSHRILTAADLSRVLELTPNEAKLPVAIRRGEMDVQTSFALSGDWKRSTDPSWRSSTHFAGPNAGFWGQPLQAAEKQRLGIPSDGLAIRINFFFNNHPSPAKAGLKNGDVLVEFDGMKKAMNVRQIHAHLQMNRDYGDKVPIVVRRDGKDLKLTLELPAKATWD